MSKTALRQSSGLDSGAMDRGRGFATRGAPSRSRRRRGAATAGRYALAVGAAALGTWARWVLERSVGPLPTFVTYYPMVVLVASLAGGGPGIVATVLAALAADYWFVAPSGFGVTAPADRLAFGIFTGANLGLCLLAERLRRARWAQAVSAAQEQDLALLDMGTILALGADHRIRRWSEGCRGLYGFDAGEAEGRVADELLQTRFPSSAEEARRVLLEEGHWEGELRRRRKDGVEVVIAALWVVRRDEQGRPSAVLEISNDVTDRKRAEDALAKAKGEWERTFDAVPDLIAILDDQQRMVRVNRPLAQRLGLDPEQCAGRHCYEAVHGTACAPEFCPHTETRADGREHVAEVHAERLGGDFLVSVTPLANGPGGRAGFVHVARDISALKRAEAAVRESQRDLNRAQAVARTGSWRLDVRRNELHWSSETHRIFGIAEGTVLSYATFLDAVHSEDRALVDGRWQAALRGEPYDVEHRIVVGSDVKWVREKAELEFDAQGALYAGFGTVQDITDRKRAEEALRESSTRFRLLAEVSAQLLGTDDPQAVVNDLCRNVMAHLGCDCFFNFLAVEGVSRLHLNAYAGVPEAEARRMEWLDDDLTVCGCVAQRGERMVAEDLQHTDGGCTRLVRALGLQAYACHPLLVQGRVLGTLSFGTKARPRFCADELALMKTVADQVAVAVERMQAAEALRRSRDELEERVRGRTAELLTVNQELEAEVVERQRAEAAVSLERQRLHELLERLPVYVVLLTPDYHVPFANRFFRERFGEAQGRRCFEYLFGRAEPCDVCETYQALKTQAPHEWEWIGPDGRNYQIFDYPFTDTDGSPRIMEMGIDVTEQKRLEAALRELNEDLEQRVAVRTSELQAANQELEAFAYSVSHDLRAPLRAIDGFSQALLEDYGARLDAEGRSYLQRSRAASQRMGQLIDGLLSLSRTTRTEMRPTVVDLSVLAHATAGELRKLEPARSVEFVIAPRLLVNADTNLMRILLQNVLGNAWKFTQKHGQARIEVGALEDHGETVYFVRDDGAGFDMAYASKLFGAFQRLHDRTEFEGTGIGLATVQRIVHRHGGRVWAEGVVEQGATIYFTLPTEPRAS